MLFEYKMIRRVSPFDGKGEKILATERKTLSHEKTCLFDRTARVRSQGSPPKLCGGGGRIERHTRRSRPARAHAGRLAGHAAVSTRFQRTSKAHSDRDGRARATGHPGRFRPVNCGTGAVACRVG